MATYATVTIITKDQNPIGTYEPVVGPIRDMVQEFSTNYFKTTDPYPTFSINNTDLAPNGSNQLEDMAKFYAQNSFLSFRAKVIDDMGDGSQKIYDESNFDSFYEYAIINNNPVFEISPDTDAYDTECFPAWISHVWNLTGEQTLYESNPIPRKKIEIFTRYCQLFMEGKILFGLRVENIDSITIELQ